MTTLHTFEPPRPEPTIGGAWQTAGPVERMVEGFLAGYRGKTRESYIDDLIQFLRWCTDQRIHPLLIQPGQLRTYVQWMQTHPAGWAEQTIARRIGTVKGMYRLATRDMLMPRNPGEFVDAPSVDRDKQRRTFLVPLEHAKFLTYVEKHGTAMDNALAAVMGVLALRVGEACSLNCGSYSTINGHRVLTFIGKGSVARVAKVTVQQMPAIEAAIGDRGPEEPLLLNRWGHRMRPVNARERVKRLAAAAGVDPDIACHSLRRSVGSTGKASGMSYEDLQVIFGHKNLATTMLYDRMQGSLNRNKVDQIAGFLGDYGRTA